LHGSCRLGLIENVLINFRVSGILISCYFFLSIKLVDKKIGNVGT